MMTLERVDEPRGMKKEALALDGWAQEARAQ
jgi:hypothetical protein